MENLIYTNDDGEDLLPNADSEEANSDELLQVVLSRLEAGYDANKLQQVRIFTPKHFFGVYRSILIELIISFHKE